MKSAIGIYEQLFPFFIILLDIIDKGQMIKYAVLSKIKVYILSPTTYILQGPSPKFPPLRQKDTPMSSRELQDEIDKMEYELRVLQQRNEVIAPSSH